MSAPALAFSFFDPDRELYGTARSGATILFDGRNPAALAGGTGDRAGRRRLAGTARGELASRSSSAPLLV